MRSYLIIFLKAQFFCFFVTAIYANISCKNGKEYANEMDYTLAHSGTQLTGTHRFRIRTAPTIGSEIILVMNAREHVIKEFSGKTKGD